MSRKEIVFEIVFNFLTHSERCYTFSAIRNVNQIGINGRR